MYDPLGNYRSVAGNWNDWSTPGRQGPTATSTATPQEQPQSAPGTATPIDQPQAALVPEVEFLSASIKAPRSRSSPAVVAEVSAPPLSARSADGWRVQLGAFQTRGAAQALFARLGRSLPSAQPYYVAEGAVTRLQAGPYASRADATQACVRLRPKPCFAIAAN